MPAGWCCTKVGCMSMIDTGIGADGADPGEPAAIGAELPLPRFEALDRAEGDDRRPRPDRGHRHHDLPGLAHHRRRHAGAGGGGRLAVRSGARGHDPGPPGGRPRHRGRCRQGGRDRARGSRRRRRAALFQGGIHATAAALAGRAGARRAAGAAHHRGRDRARRDRPISSRLREALAEQVPPASLDDHREFVDHMRADDPRDRGGRHRRAGAGDARDRAVGDVRDPRRDGDQPSGHRGAAFHRRQEQLHRRPFPAPFPAARPARAGDRGRARPAACSRSSISPTAGSWAARRARSSPPCSAPSRSGLPAMRRCWRRSS